MSKRIEEEIKFAADFAGKAEGLILAKGQCATGERNTPLMAYWSLAFEFHKARASLLKPTATRFENGLGCSLILATSAWATGAQEYMSIDPPQQIQVGSSQVERA